MEAEQKTYEEQLKEYEESLIKAQENLQKREEQLNQYVQGFGTIGKQNLVEWELDFRAELEDIAHALRCDLIKVDKDGNQYWVENPDKSKVFLNELGVNDVLRMIITLVNKNKVLSNYSIDEIKLRVRLIGHEIRALIYNNYEEYGIDNEYKMNNFSPIVLNILDIIESAYRRSLGGETHRGLSEQRLVTQSENVSASPMNIQQQQKKFHWYNPTTWIK